MASIDGNQKRKAKLWITLAGCHLSEARSGTQERRRTGPIERDISRFDLACNVADRPPSSLGPRLGGLTPADGSLRFARPSSRLVLNATRCVCLAHQFPSHTMTQFFAAKAWPPTRSVRRKNFRHSTDGELHAVLCYCHFGPTVSAVELARVLRRVVAQAGRSSLASWVRRIFVLG